MSPPQPRPATPTALARARSRSRWSPRAVAVAVGPPWGRRDGNLLTRYDASKAAAVEARPPRRPARHGAAQPQRPGHQEPRSPAPATPAGPQDPTTAAQKQPARAYVAAERPHRRPAADRRSRSRQPAPAAPAGPLRDGERLLPAHPARRAAVLQADRPRHLPALRRRPAVRQRRRRHGRRARRRRPSGRPEARAARSPSPTAATPLQRRRHAPRSGPTRTTGCTAYPESQIDVSGDPHAGRHAVPGGARLRRRAHPRHGLRVPRRRRALRQALGPVRRAVRARRLPRPHRDRRLRRRRSRRRSPASRTTTRSAGRRSRTGRRRTR